MKLLFFISLSFCIFQYSCVTDEKKENNNKTQQLYFLDTIKSKIINLDTFVNYLFIERDRNIINNRCQEQPQSFGDLSHDEQDFFFNKNYPFHVSYGIRDSNNFNCGRYILNRMDLKDYNKTEVDSILFNTELVCIVKYKGKRDSVTFEYTEAIIKNQLIENYSYKRLIRIESKGARQKIGLEINMFQ